MLCRRRKELQRKIKRPQMKRTIPQTRRNRPSLNVYLRRHSHLSAGPRSSPFPREPRTSAWIIWPPQELVQTALRVRMERSDGTPLRKTSWYCAHALADEVSLAADDLACSIIGREGKE